MKQQLIDQVLKQIQIDINNKDLTAIEELLKQINDETLINYLPEEEI